MLEGLGQDFLRDEEQHGVFCSHEVDDAAFLQQTELAEVVSEPEPVKLDSLLRVDRAHRPLRDPVHAAGLGTARQDLLAFEVAVGLQRLRHGDAEQRGVLASEHLVHDGLLAAAADDGELGRADCGEELEEAVVVEQVVVVRRVHEAEEAVERRNERGGELGPRGSLERPEPALEVLHLFLALLVDFLETREDRVRHRDHARHADQSHRHHQHRVQQLSRALLVRQDVAVAVGGDGGHHEVHLVQQVLQLAPQVLRLQSHCARGVGLGRVAELREVLEVHPE